MADYYSYSRTNYFKVNNPEAFKELFSKVDCEIIEENDTFAILDNGCGSIMSYWDDEKEEDVDVLKQLQPLLPDGEAAIFMEIGHEKLRYLVGCGVIVTNKDIVSIDLHRMLLEKAKELTENENISSVSY